MSANIEERDLEIVPADGTSPNGCQWVILETLPPLKRVVGAIVHLRFTKPVLVLPFQKLPHLERVEKPPSETYFARHIACRNF